MRTIFQNTRNTSLPNKVNDKNIKKTNNINSFCSCDSVESSLLPEFGPPYPFGPVLFGPKISSHVKFSENRAGNKPKPITKPPLEFPKMLLLFPPNAPNPLLKFWLGYGSLL